jgi:hypothetical protein
VPRLSVSAASSRPAASSLPSTSASTAPGPAAGARSPAGAGSRGAWWRHSFAASRYAVVGLTPSRGTRPAVVCGSTRALWAKLDNPVRTFALGGEPLIREARDVCTLRASCFGGRATPGQRPIDPRNQWTSRRPSGSLRASLLASLEVQPRTARDQLRTDRTPRPSPDAPSLYFYSFPAAYACSNWRFERM